MKRLLLTGSTGYLGQHLKEFYSASGWLVETLGRSPECDYQLNESNLNSVLKIFKNEKYDRIIHAAALNETEINDDLCRSYEVNVSLTRLLLELAVILDVKEFVYVSTFHVYGVSEGIVSEETKIKPKNDYALTHYLSEEIVRFIGKEKKIKTLIVRPTNIYGLPVNMEKFNRWSLVPFAFVRQAKREGCINLHSSGLQYRDFVDVADVVECTTLINKLSVVNACGSESMTIRVFAELVADVAKENRIDCQVTWKGEGNSTPQLYVSNRLNRNSKKETLKIFLRDMWKLCDSKI